MRQAATVLDLPLDTWTTVALTGSPVDAGGPGGDFTVSTVALSERGRQRLQVRVSRP